MITKTINITARDIILGTKANCGKCPTARALRRVVKNRDIQVGTYRIWIDMNSNKHISTPSIVKAFIFSFDGGKTVFPFSFKLSIPEDWFEPRKD